ELVAEWYAIHTRSVKPDSAAHALTHVRYIFPEGVRVLASEVTPQWLSARLYDCRGRRNTLRKIHSSLSVFLNYCVRPKGILRSELVAEWYAIHTRSVKPDSAAHALTHVRYIFPEGVRVLASEVTPQWLSARLYDCRGRRNTLRKIHSSLSVFLNYCVRPKGIL